MKSPKQHLRALNTRIYYSSPSASEWVTLNECMLFAENDAGAPSELRCQLSVTIGEKEYDAKGDSREEALFSLEKALPAGSFFRICHQCRFGLYHPLQGSEMSCLKEHAEAADDVNKNGKYATEINGFGELPTSELCWCVDFQRPAAPPGRPGATCRV